jgi:hypothetical protein
MRVGFEGDINFSQPSRRVANLKKLATYKAKIIENPFKSH